MVTKSTVNSLAFVSRRMASEIEIYCIKCGINTQIYQLFCGSTNIFDQKLLAHDALSALFDPVVLSLLSTCQIGAKTT